MTAEDDLVEGVEAQACEGLGLGDQSYRLQVTPAQASQPVGHTGRDRSPGTDQPEADLAVSLMFSGHSLESGESVRLSST